MSAEGKHTPFNSTLYKAGTGEPSNNSESPNEYIRKLLVDNQRLREVVRQQTEALEKIEYVGMGGYTACPRCMGEGGHGEDCEIPIAIKAGKDVLNESHRS